MKKFIFLAVLTTITFGTLHAQTTLIEYNYITSGLQDDLGKGKDIKSGYALENSGIFATLSWNGQRISSRTATIYYFKKTATKKTVALVIECKDSKNNLKYRCIPTKDATEEVWNKVYESMVQDNDWVQVYTWAFSKFIAMKGF